MHIKDFSSHSSQLHTAPKSSYLIIRIDFGIGSLIIPMDFSIKFETIKP